MCTMALDNVCLHFFLPLGFKSITMAQMIFVWKVLFFLQNVTFNQCGMIIQTQCLKPMIVLHL